MLKRFAVLAILLGGNVHAAEVDPRAEVVIQVSQSECASVWARLRAKDANGGALFVVETDAQSDALARVRAACGFEEIEKAIAAWQAKPVAKRGDLTFTIARTPRKIPRDALAQILEWATPTKDKPIAMELDPMFRVLRSEWREVLAGRDPYAAAPVVKK